MKMVSEIDKKRVVAFCQKLAALPEKRITLNKLREVFHECFPHRPRGTEDNDWLLFALREADSRDIIRIPPSHGTRWNTTLNPPLPSSVDRIETSKTLRNAWWKSFLWHPAIDWIADLRVLPLVHEDFLKRVNAGLVNGDFDQLAPFKYRSLQLTRDEKRLQKLTKSILFKPERLTLELLGCLPEIPLLVWEQIGLGTKMLVFENNGAFTVARNVLQGMKEQPYGIIACGEGSAFIKSIQQIASIHRTISEIEYVGDIDPPGLHIAQLASLSAKKENLPQVVPASAIYLAMVKAVKQFGEPLGLVDKHVKARSDYSNLVAWLPLEIQELAIKMFSNRRRIPEEVLGPNELLNIWNSSNASQWESN